MFHLANLSSDENM